MKNINITLGIIDIRKNKEDLVLTPFIGIPYLNNNYVFIIGISITFIFWSIGLGAIYSKQPHRKSQTKQISNS